MGHNSDAGHVPPQAAKTNLAALDTTLDHAPRHGVNAKALLLAYVKRQSLRATIEPITTQETQGPEEPPEPVPTQAPTPDGVTTRYETDELSNSLAPNLVAALPPQLRPVIRAHLHEKVPQRARQAAVTRLFGEYLILLGRGLDLVPGEAESFFASTNLARPLIRAARAAAMDDEVKLAYRKCFVKSEYSHVALQVKASALRLARQLEISPAIASEGVGAGEDADLDALTIGKVHAGLRPKDLASILIERNRQETLSTATERGQQEKVLVLARQAGLVGSDDEDEVGAAEDEPEEQTPNVTTSPIASKVLSRETYFNADEGATFLRSLTASEMLIQARQQTETMRRDVVRFVEQVLQPYTESILAEESSYLDMRNRVVERVLDSHVGKKDAHDLLAKQGPKIRAYAEKCVQHLHQRRKRAKHHHFSR